jgi:hypothetical protein
LTRRSPAALLAFLAAATDARRIYAVNNHGDLVLSMIRIVAPSDVAADGA